MWKILRICVGLLAAAAGNTTLAQAPDCGNLFDEHQVLDLHVTMAPAAWEALRLSCPGGDCGPGSHSYWPAALRCEDGPEITVGIRRKNGQADPSNDDPQKPAIKIDINEFVPGQTFHGKSKLNLENGSSSAGGSGSGNDNGVKEGLSWLLYEDSGIVAPRVAWVNLWINGVLKGLYTNVEQINQEFLIDHGIDEGGWLFKGIEQKTREAEVNAFAFNWYPFDHSIPAEPQPADWRDQAGWRVDLSQLFALAAVANFVSNVDAAVFKASNYWYYDWEIIPEGQQPRLYFGWDLDTTMTRIDEPVLGTFQNNGHMAQALLRDDPLFQAQYYTAYGDLLDGTLSLASTIARVNAIEAAISADLDADPHQTAGSAAEQFSEVRDFLTARTAFVLAELDACPDSVCDASESPCSCPADCGAPPASESVCTDAIDEDCDAAVDCSDADCSLLPACDLAPLLNEIVVNEIVSNSDGSPDVEFVEILNSGPGAQDLTGWYLLDDDNAHDACFLDAILQPGEFLVIAGFVDGFLLEYPDAASALNPNQFDSATLGAGFSLSDGGDHVRLFRPTTAGGEFVSGHTTGPQGEEIPFGYLPEGSDAPEYLATPTPGLSNNVTSYHSAVCINEFQTTSQAGGVDDWVELYNRGSAPVDISGWYLSDTASDPTKYVFPPGTTIGSGEFLTLDEIELGFAFSSTGSEVVLLTHADGLTGQDYFDYGPQLADVSRGRYPDGAPYWLFFDTPSRGVANGCRVADLRFASSGDLQWDAAAGVTAYDVVGGDLQLLHATGGDYSASVDVCAGNDIGSTSTTVDAPLASGQGLFYLVRAADAECGSGSYDSTSTAQLAGRDPGIADAPAACP